MSPTSNYIRVRSERRLRQQNRESQQAIFKAGSNDRANQPGKVKDTASIISEITSVHNAPQTITTNVQFGETLNTRMSVPGGGSVGMPPEQPRSMLTSHELVYPYSFTQRWRSKNLLTETPPSNIDRPDVTNNAGSNQLNPLSANSAGSVASELERTTAKDGERPKRTRNRRRRNNINRTT